MNTKPILLCVLTALAAPMLAMAGASDADSAQATQYVEDSAITAAVKTKLAADHVGSLTDLKVDTDQEGTVWLSGSTLTQESADRAVESARNVHGVAQVRSSIVVAPRTK